MKGMKLPDTTLTRAIVIEMKRKKAGDQVEHFRHVDDAGLAELRRRALRWAIDNGEKFEGAEPVMPPDFDSRLGDNWRLQFAVADAAGGEWPDKARKAAVKLTTKEADSIGVKLLAAIKAVFDGADGSAPLDRISSVELATMVGDDATSPFSEWGKSSKPITQNQLARVLKPFSIHPGVLRLSGSGTPRGYLRSQFEDAWERYLPAGPP
jgi:hypothetical protein